MQTFRRSWTWLVSTLRSQSNSAVRVALGVFVGIGLLFILLPVALVYELVTRLSQNRLGPATRWAIAALSLVVVFAVLGALSPADQVGVAAQSTSPSPTVAGTPTPTEVAVTTPTPVASPSIAATTKLTAAEIAEVERILSTSVKHYEDLFAGGKAALGTDQYADAFEGLDAMQDPNSGAARFRDWRASSDAERDLSYFDAFGEADAFFTAENEPDALLAWSDDMDSVTIALVDWVDVAVSWQISVKTDAELSAAAAAVTSALERAQADIAETVAQSS